MALANERQELLGLSLADLSKVKVVIVTAQKRSQKLQNVPIAISHLSRAEIENFGFAHSTDIQYQIPGMIVSNSSTGAIPNFTIRGIGLNDFTAIQNSPIAVHIDEVYLGSATLQNFPLFDVDRVEVLKGPQGILYGRNSTGGAVNFFSARPTKAFEAGGSLEFAKYEASTVEGYLSGAISDELLARFSFFNNQQDSGPYSHPVYGDVGERDLQAWRLQLLWQPTDQADARVIFYRSKDDSDSSQFQSFGTIDESGQGFCEPVIQGDVDSKQDQCFSLPPTTPGLDAVQSADDDPFTLQSGVINHDTIEVKGLTAAVSYQLRDSAISSITGFNQSDRNSQEDADGTSLRAIDVGYETEFKQFSEELRLSSQNDNAHEWTLGVYYSKDELNTPRTETDLSDVFDGLRQNHAYELDTNTAAIFAHSEYAISNKLSVLGGLRFTHEDRSFKGGTYTVASGVGPSNSGDFVASPTPVPNLNDGDAFADAYTRQTVSFNHWSWHFGGNYHFNDNAFIYASVSNGFKSGGFVGDITVQSVLENPYDEETLTAYDIGIKTELLDRTLRFNTSLFYYDYHDVILAVDVIRESDQLTFFANDNVSDATVYGVETDLIWVPNEHWQVRIAGTFLDTEQEQTVAVAQKIDGSELPYSPRWNISAAIAYKMELTDQYSAFIQLDAVSRSSHYGEAESIPIAEIDSYSVANAMFKLSDNKNNWGLSVWVKNLSNESYYTYLNNLQGLGAVIKTPGMPRTYGLKLDFDF